MYQIQHTWYVVCLQGSVPGTGTGTSSVGTNRREYRRKDIFNFSSKICLLLLVAKSNRLGLFEEEGKMRPVFEIEIDILSTENGYLGGVFYNSSRLSDILPDSRSLFEIED